jgi:MoaA/NifB/PqqE/SkfB family radical SAM enzyme
MRALVSEHTGGDMLSSKGVKEIYVMLTFGCNIRCRICPYWGETGICHDADLYERYKGKWDPVAMRRFLAGMREFGPRLLNISGGEPLLSPHWADLARMAKVLEYEQVELTTNASFLAPKIEQVARLVDTLQVSFTSPTEWKRGFGMSGDTDPAEWGPALRAVFKQAKRVNPRLRIVVNYALHREGVDAAESFASEALAEPGLVDAFHLVHPMYLSPSVLAAHKADLAKFDTDGRFWEGFGAQQDDTDTDTLRQTLADIQAKHPTAVVFPHIADHELELWYGDGGYTPERYRDLCGAPWTQLHVIPSGDVWVCYDVVIGNIHTDDAQTIWNGARARRLRKHLAEEGLFSGCSGCFLKYTVEEGGTSARPPTGAC